MRRLALIAALILLTASQARAATNGISADHSKGAILLGSPSGVAPCNAGNTGAIRYNSASPGIEYCNGTIWQTANYRVCMIVIGADNGGALANADISPQGQQCYVSTASTIVEINVRADAGTPNVLLQRRRGAATVADLSSAVLATGAAGAAACAMSSTSQTCLDGTTSSGTVTLSNTALNAGDWIETKSATAGGTAKRLSIAVVYRVN